MKATPYSFHRHTVLLSVLEFSLSRERKHQLASFGIQSEVIRAERKYAIVYEVGLNDEKSLYSYT